jgi:hypothetical protein
MVFFINTMFTISLLFLLALFNNGNKTALKNLFKNLYQSIIDTGFTSL